MGGFLLFKKNGNISTEEIERQHQGSINVFKKKGLKLRKRIVRENFVIFVFDKYLLKTKDLFEFTNGDFILSTGTSIYNGRTGAHALKALYQDISEEKDFQPHLFGNYCIILLLHSKLFIFNDYTGLYKVYRNSSESIFSSSFLALVKSLPHKRSVSQQEVYEYVFHGAFFGDKTIFKEIDLLDNRYIWQISPERLKISRNFSFHPLRSDKSFDEMITTVSGDLIQYFKLLKTAFDNDIASALSGGYDTRLMLAVMRKVGISPYLYVYGGENSIDVKIAKSIAKGDGFELDDIDKTKFPKVDKPNFYKIIERNYYLFDGLSCTGVFDQGADIDTRIERTKKANVQLNGGGGEIYRTTWRISGDKKINIRNFLKNKYGPVHILEDFADYSICSGAFDKQTYYSNLTEKIKAILDIGRDWMTRQQAEMLYSSFFLKYWMGINNSINNQFAYAITPYAEPWFVYQSVNIPMEYKRFGQFQAALIKRIDPHLAKYPSGYGFNFYDPIGWKRKMKENIKETLKFSFFIRPMMPHLTTKRMARKYELPYYLQRDYLEEIFNVRDLSVGQYIDLKRVKEPSMLSRVLSLELLFESKF